MIFKALESGDGTPHAEMAEASTALPEADFPLRWSDRLPFRGGRTSRWAVP